MTGFNSKRQAAQAKLDDDDAQGYIAQYEAALSIEYQCGVADGKRAAQQQADPGTREGFTDWWNGDYDDSANRFEKDSAAYWAWAGWQAAQRPWQGLTDEDWAKVEDMSDTFDQGVAWAAARLKEKNSD